MKEDTKRNIPVDLQAAWNEACEQAADYVKQLESFVKEKTYLHVLIEDFRLWKKEHMKRRIFPDIFSKQNERSKDFEPVRFLRKLEEKGKLEQYLNRSISYIYLRDLGKDLRTPEMQVRIDSATTRIRQDLLEKINVQPKVMQESFSLSSLYRFAQREGIEETMIWLVEKLKKVSDHIPSGMDSVHAKRKLIKMIGGVVLSELDEMEHEKVTGKERTERLKRAVRLGYCYGLSYPFVDDLLDSKALSDEEKNQYSDLIRTTLITGNPPVVKEWKGENAEFMKFVYLELSNAFKYIIAGLEGEMKKRFIKQAYIFYSAQELNRTMHLDTGTYSNEEILIPVILKSAFSRLIVRSVIQAPPQEDFEERMFYYGIYNQLADDFTDLFADFENGLVTPYTYYLKNHNERKDLLNPFELYWAVISYLIHQVYRSDEHTREVILSRAINSLKRYRKRVGAVKYEDLMRILAATVPELNEVIQLMVKKAEDVDFFDKLIRDEMIKSIETDEEEQREFMSQIRTARRLINQTLPISKSGEEQFLNKTIIEGANYVLESGGKRLRPIIAFVVGQSGYGFKTSSLIPLLRALEYMHTASLIFDDLPSQDDAPLRRGRPTLHKIYDVATAELTALFLTQKATEELASLTFSSERVLEVIRYSAQVVMDMCLGQMADLESVEKSLSLEELNRMSFYKTGLAFEAALLMPAILAGVDDKEKEALKKFSYHAGIAFQIKDDLLDAEGEEALLGKPVGQDEGNRQATFVTVLGVDGAKKALFEHYCSAVDVLAEVPRNTSFLKHLMNLMIMRNR